MYKFLFFLLASAYCQDLDAFYTSIFKTANTPTGSQAPPVVTSPTVLSSLGDKKGESSTLVPALQNPDDQDKYCITDKGEEGECVPFYLCSDQTNTVITDGTGVFDVRGLNRKCTDELDKCCLVGDKISPEDPITSKPPTNEKTPPGSDQHETPSTPTGSQAPPVVTSTTVPSSLGAKKGESSTLVPAVQNPDDQDKSCITDKGEEGECVALYLCNDKTNTVITDGAGVIDIRGLNGKCASYFDKCCLVGDKRPPEDPITPKPPTNEEARVGCGWRNPKGVGFKITGDNDGEAQFGEFPWMVAILNIEPVKDQKPDGQKLNGYLGGGSLIHPSVVLTAAHYVATGGRLRVRAGEWDTQTTKEIYPHQERDVDQVEIHKDFNKGNLFYDIALLFLSKPMDLTPHVGVVCLPPPRERVQAGTRCFASGWGKDKFENKVRYQVILKKIELPVVDRNTCQERLRKTRLGRHFELHSSFMCAGGEPGKDTCTGDGGSPLVCPIEFEKDRYIQSGIVAWGIGCAKDGTPGVYVDVSNLRTWIDDKMIVRKYDLKIYTY